MTDDNMVIHRDGPAHAAVLEAWFEGSLSPNDAEKLCALVADAGPWRDAYRATLCDLAGEEALVPRLDAERSISVAVSDAELEHAELVDLLPLPHLGGQAHREGRLTAEGTLWRVVGADDPVPEVRLARGVERLVWNDPILGQLETPLREFVPDARHVAHDALVSVSRLADGLEHSRADAVARAVTDDLGRGSLHRGLVGARDAFVNAKLDDEDEQAWVVCALETQLALDRLAHRLCDPELDAQLLAAEKRLAALGEALMLLEERTYADLVQEHDVERDAWWGFRARLDAGVPDARLSAQLDAEDAAQPQEHADVVQLFGNRDRAGDATSVPYRAAAAATEPGTAWILVTLDAPGSGVDGEGRVLRATIKRSGPGNPFKRCPWFGPVARDAIRDAYEAVSSLCRDGMAPRPLEEHAIFLDDPGEIGNIDGSSLGLAFALAFASLWADKTYDHSVGATGRLFQTRTVWNVGTVDRVRAKVEALCAALGRPPVFLAATEHAHEIEPAGAEHHCVETVAGALEHAGLDLSQVEGAWPDRRARADALAELVARVQSQDVERFGGFGRPWLVVAGRMETLAQALTGPKHEVLVRQAWPLAALAYVHAGQLGAASTVLNQVSMEEASPEVKLAAHIVALNGAIDRADFDLCAAQAQAIDALLAVLPADEHADLVGQALGTKGRARLHAREFSAAKTLLTAAIEHHAERRPDEVGRSRVYLATVLRNLGQLDEALLVLEQAERDLHEHTRPESVAYARNCMMFLLYERARVLVALGDAKAALLDTEEALRLSRHLGSWPRLGLLRVAAWAHRLRGEHGLADARVAEMRELEVGELAGLRDRLVEEAAGAPRPDGEVY